MAKKKTRKKKGARPSKDAPSYTTKVKTKTPEKLGGKREKPKADTPPRKKLDKNGQHRGTLSPAFIAHQWRPGQSGNTKKVKRGLGLVAYLKKYLNDPVQSGKDKGKRRGDALMERMAQLARSSQGASHLKQLLDRIEGPVPTKIEGGDEPVRMSFTFVEAAPPADDGELPEDA